jgi:hypothetical protein
MARRRSVVYHLGADRPEVAVGLTGVSGIPGIVGQAPAGTNAILGLEREPIDPRL